jgi:hypothetical protein
MEVVRRWSPGRLFQNQILRINLADMDVTVAGLLGSPSDIASQSDYVLIAFKT